MIVNTLNRLSCICFLVVVALIPVQLGYHFWPDYSLIYGIRHDQLASILYLSDLAIFSLLFLWIAALILQPTKLKIAPLIFLSLLPAAFLVSSFFSANFQLSIYKTAKLTEFALLALYISQTRFNSFKLLLAVVAGSQLVVSLLAVGQFVQQESLGFWLLGERQFSVTTPAIAQVSLSGQQLLRPYATFPHPNLLAGFLALSLPVNFLAIYKLKAGGWRYLLIFVTVLGLLALLLSFSRSGWVGLILATAPLLGFIWKKRAVFSQLLLLFKRSPKLMAFSISVILVVGGLALNLVLERFLAIFSTDSHSLLLRGKLLISSWEMFKTSVLVGVGPGQFLISLPDFFQVQEVIRFFQPVHNIYLLQLAETGILGLAALLVLQLAMLFFAFRKRAKVKFLILGQLAAIIFIGSLDHYFFTLQQGQLLFWIIAGFALQSE